MIRKRHHWTRRRRRRPKPGSLHVCCAPGRRRPCVEPLEDRLLLSAIADFYSADGGYIDLSTSSLGHVTGCGDAAHVVTIHPDEGPEGGGVGSPDATPSGSPVPPGHSSDAGPIPSQPSDVSGTDAPATHCDDAVLLRLEPNESSSSSSGDGLIDLTRVLSEPAPSIGRAPADWEHCGVRVASRADRAGSDADGAEEAATSDSRLDGRRPASATSPGRTAAAGSHPFLAHPGRLRGSPYGAIEGSRGISQAFEVATSPEQGSIGDGPASDTDHGLPSAPTLDRSVWSPHRLSPSQANPHSPQMARSPDLPPRTSGRALDAVGARVLEAELSHDVVLAELTGPSGDAFFNAVYLDDRRPIEVIPLLAVAAVGQHLATKQWHAHDNDRTRLAHPPRRRPSGGLP